MTRLDRFTYIAIGLVLGLGLALLFLAWAVPEFRDPSYQQETGEAARQNDADNEPGEPHHKPEWRYWAERLIGLEDTPAQWIMAVFAVLATGASIWAVWLLRRTLDHTRIATEAAVAQGEVTRTAIEVDQRPWIHLSVKAKSGLDFTDTGAEVRALLTLENVGKTPAIGIAIYFEALPSHDGGLPTDGYSGFVRRARLNSARNVGPAGMIVFPTKTSNVHVDLAIPGPDGRTFPPGVNIRVCLAVCVTYRSGGSGTQRSTSILYLLHRKTGDGEYDLPLGGESVPREAVVFIGTAAIDPE